MFVFTLFQVPTASSTIESSGSLSRCRWSHTGNHIAAGDDNGRVYFFDVGEVGWGSVYFFDVGEVGWGSVYFFDVGEVGWGSGTPTVPTDWFLSFYLKISL